MRWFRHFFRQNKCVWCKRKIRLFAHYDVVSAKGVRSYCSEMCYLEESFQRG